MRIGIFAPLRHGTARALLEALNKLEPGCALPFALDAQPPEPTTLDAARLDWNGVDAGRLDRAVVLGFSYADPVVPAGDLDVDWSLWQWNYLATQQQYSYLYSFFCELERRGVRLLNPPAAHLAAFMKPALLERLRAAGLRVPATLCSNRLETVQDFERQAGHVAWRPATGRAAWQLFKERQRAALISLKRPPVLLAEAVDGPLLRAYVHEGKVLVCLATSVPDAEKEERLEEFWAQSCPEAEADLARAAGVLDARWCQALFVLKDQRPWFYDLDADPALDGLTPFWRDWLVRALAARVLERPAAVPALPQGELARTQRARPALFLRRMLQILFEFEASKYPKEKEEKKPSGA